MARLRISKSIASSRGQSVANSLYRDPSIPPSEQKTPKPNQISSRATRRPGSSSDKENRASIVKPTKSEGMATPNTQTAHSSKRRRLADLDGSVQYESSSGESESAGDPDEVQVVQQPRAKGKGKAQQATQSQYDPHQPMDERRTLRKNMRELTKELHDQRKELSAPNSRALEDMIQKQNGYFQDVKQTSDATIDSRFLVNAGEITYKRTRTLNVGENAQTVDVEEFIGKCISFMKDGSEQNMSATQRSRRAPVATAAENDDEEDIDQGDALDWTFFGYQACRPVNTRPPTMSFLLGPLSVQKRARAPRMRRERLARAAPVETVQAKELRAEEMVRPGTSSLTLMCMKILEQFHNAYTEGHTYVTQFWDAHDDDEELDDEDEALFKKRNVIMADGGLSLFKFVINPRDFGQSVENTFYLSFLVRDDFIQVKFDEDGLPSLHAVDPEVKANEERKKGPKHQAILALDYQTWEQLIELNDISKSLIPHRTPDPAATRVSKTGWYG